MLNRMALLRVVASGMAYAWQTASRGGLRRVGVTPGGPMDDHAAGWANRLVGNDVAEPVLELLWGGAKVEILEDAYVAVTGAPIKVAVPLWRATPAKAGQVLEFAPAGPV